MVMNKDEKTLVAQKIREQYAETGSDIPKDLADKYGSCLVPVHVTFGDEEKDDATFPPKDIY